MNTHIELPELSQERQDQIEREIFAAIAQGAPAPARPRSRRRAIWSTAAAAAVIVVAAAVVGPALTGSFETPGAVTARESAGDGDAGGSGSDLADTSAEQGAFVVGADAGPAASEETAREVIATASVSLQVDDADEAAADIGRLAEDVGGYVESLSLVNGGSTVPSDEGYVETMPYAGDAWISVRVPAAELTSVTAALADIGEVRSSEISRQDVTTEVVDLRARVAALQASVDRLRELMADAATTADLLTAEDALADRQADLDALKAQLAVIDDQVALSSLSVSMIPPSPTVTADPTGFGDGLGAGWNALVATLNGIVIGLGFLLPWLAVIAIAALVVWLIIRGRRRARGRRS
ncbi:DUF4349 domain-containing protein, partial [Microbacterium sp.]|uniref:DUF4349 domain-containing protein n=1 Tax=Microbacterium sp. TaxID=51671 RepID=UPI003736C9D2